MYASSTRATTKSDEKKLEVFERKILRKIVGPKKNNEGEYEIRSNKKLAELYNETNIVRILKSARIGWAGHGPGQDPGQDLWTWQSIAGSLLSGFRRGADLRRVSGHRHPNLLPTRPSTTCR